MSVLSTDWLLAGGVFRIFGVNHKTMLENHKFLLLVYILVISKEYFQFVQVK